MCGNCKSHSFLVCFQFNKRNFNITQNFHQKITVVCADLLNQIKSNDIRNEKTAKSSMKDETKTKSLEKHNLKWNEIQKRESNVN